MWKLLTISFFSGSTPIPFDFHAIRSASHFHPWYSQLLDFRSIVSHYTEFIFVCDDIRFICGMKSLKSSSLEDAVFASILVLSPLHLLPLCPNPRNRSIFFCWCC